ncbi:hypothetical protein F3Y22_tig00110783pilonHSYRG00321 [Hibiscus syriacus]|uniref:Calmodulin-binding domain-containing protein n=2 Tax=Hibiscus syriacus TaxID=106335 RepID=A0A6A2ZRA2_HIBSY|nr:hypothetical protein F3Y22_tig00110783pilonHSYRG00321 [Hibiscus syriacus]
MTPGINGGNPRRTSLAGSANRREKSVSHFRRASIGTSNDICIPGKKLESLPKRIIKKPLDDPNLFDSSKRKKISAIRSKSLPNSPVGNGSTIHKVSEDKMKPKSSPRLKSQLSDAGRVLQHDGSSPSGRVHVKKVPLNANEKSFSKRPVTSNTKSRVEKLLPAALSERLSRGSLSRRASLSGAIRLTARKNMNLKVVVPQKNRNEVVESAKTEQLDTLKEKTLYVIKLETENVMLDSDKNENCTIEVSPPVRDESEYTLTEANHDSHSAYNEDNNGPWQLKFRQGSVLGENQNSISEGHGSFTRQVDAELDGEANDKEHGEGKDVLRQQEVVGKGLFNKVIEETANKLVETQKSKVKALVGAFETVISISLQDAKASTNTVSE